jgi:hypothetical protein
MDRAIPTRNRRSYCHAELGFGDNMGGVEFRGADDDTGVSVCAITDVSEPDHTVGVVGEPGRVAERDESVGAFGC